MRAIITGASSGIGKAIYDHLKKGAENIVCGVSRRGPDVKVDLRTAMGVSELWRLLNEDARPLDALILNAGIMSFAEAEDWQNIYEVNFHSVWDCLENLEIEGPCSIILNASVAGVKGEADMPYYAALKAALINMTKSYAKRYISVKIRVNCFSCGFFDTNLVPSDGDDVNVLQEIVDGIPMKRVAQPEEILPVIDMLLQCEYITGQNIIVDGGLTLL